MGLDHRGVSLTWSGMRSEPKGPPGASEYVVVFQFVGQIEQLGIVSARIVNF